MHLQDFRQIVDQTLEHIAAYEGDPVRLYAYVGLSFQTSYSDKAVSDALYERIRNAFASGHGEAWRICRSLEADLIREHVILDVPLDPYFEVLSHLKDALRARADEASKINGDWHAAIQAAQDHVKVSSYKTSEHRRIFAREFAVAEAAKLLKQLGYDIRLGPGFIALEEISEKSLVARIEDLIAHLGGLNVARKMFAEISPAYDVDLQRYHLVPHISPMGGRAATKAMGIPLATRG